MTDYSETDRLLRFAAEYRADTILPESLIHDALSGVDCTARKRTGIAGATLAAAATLVLLLVYRQSQQPSLTGNPTTPASPVHVASSEPPLVAVEAGISKRRFQISNFKFQIEPPRRVNHKRRTHAPRVHWRTETVRTVESGVLETALVGRPDEESHRVVVQPAIIRIPLSAAQEITPGPESSLEIKEENP